MAIQTQSFKPGQRNPYFQNLGMEQAFPNLSGLTSSATNLIQSELGGLPSPAETRTANAAWGAGAGLAPSQGMDFLGQRGSRLYRSEIENRQRQGLQDFLNSLRAYSGTVVPTTGQALDDRRATDRQRFEQLMAQMESQLTERNKRPKFGSLESSPSVQYFNTLGSGMSRL